MWDHGALLGILTLVLYIWIAPEHIVDGDNAEFSTLGTLGGTGHPSGYPAYVLWLRAWSWLPGASPAHTAAIATAILSALQMVVLIAACRAWGIRAAAANVAVMILAGAPVILAIYTEAEVFAMNGLVAATVLWLAGAAGPLRGRWRCAVLGLIAGIGMANHLTCTLLAPVGLLGVVRGVRESSASTRTRPLAAGFAIGGLVVGLTPYLYLLVAPEHWGTWGKPETLGDVLHVFLRNDYGGPGTFAAGAAEPYPLENLVALGHTLARTWLYVPALMGLGALGYQIARPGPVESRWGWALLLASLLLAGPLLVMRFNVLPGDGLSTYVIERFHLLVMVIFVIPVAAGFQVVGELVARRLSGRALGSRGVGMALVTCGFAAIVSTSLPHVLVVHAPAVELLVRNMLRSLPHDAVVIGASDDFHSGTPYVQLVLGERRDVVYVNWPMMRSAWYRARRARAGVVLEMNKPGVASIRLAESVLASGRPLFVDMMQGNILESFPSYPHGILYRVLPRGAQPPPIEEVFALNKQLYERFEITYPRPGLDDQWATMVHVKYAWPWRRLAAALRKAGRLEDAAWALEAAREIGPQQ